MPKKLSEYPPRRRQTLTRSLHQTRPRRLQHQRSFCHPRLHRSITSKQRLVMRSFRPHVKLSRPTLLPSADVMADVLGFLTRKMIALQLARVNRRLSALCSCWCRPEKEYNAEAVVYADSLALAAAVSASSALEHGHQRKSKLKLKF